MRIKHESLRNEATNTAWGKVHFDNNGHAVIDDPDAHASLIKIPGFADPDAAPAISLVDAAGKEHSTLTHLDLVRLEAALTDAYQEIQRLTADVHSRADVIFRLQTDKEKLEVQVARLLHEAEATRQGSEVPIPAAERARHDKTAADLQKLKLEHKALKEENHQLRLVAAGQAKAPGEEAAGE